MKARDSISRVSRKVTRREVVEALGAMGAALAATGERDKARAVLRQLQAEARRRYIPPRSLVIVLAQLGESDEAFRVLDLAVEERSDIVHLLKVHPLLDSLRADRRFETLLRRVGLPPA